MKIERCVSQRWKEYAFKVFVQPIVLFENIQDSVFCILEYIFGEPEEEIMLRQVVDYLLNIAVNHEIYYYRCSDFIGLVDLQRPIIEIEIDDLFNEEYAPLIGASLMEKYRLKKA
ncbi:hypothetical protein H6F89_18515 [Cyanobacteria bacterium FACHB-63]|nr:hypothetical protein [Cyanobacteria bacterium FACHB-63]